MYNEYYETLPYSYTNVTNQSDNYIQGEDERGFLFPFVLGGITGGLLAPAFYRPYPYYYGRPFYGPTPFYGPYYRRWY